MCIIKWNLIISLVSLNNTKSQNQTCTGIHSLSAPTDASLACLSAALSLRYWSDAHTVPFYLPLPFVPASPWIIPLPSKWFCTKILFEFCLKVPVVSVSPPAFFIHVNHEFIEGNIPFYFIFFILCERFEKKGITVVSRNVNEHCCCWMLSGSAFCCWQSPSSGLLSTFSLIISYSKYRYI